MILLNSRNIGLDSRGEISPAELNQMKAVGQLRSMGIKVKRNEAGTYSFVIPKSVEEKLRKVYEFSIEELSVGGDIPLGELARHVDEQPASEARAGLVAEVLRHELNKVTLEYEAWYNKIFWECKSKLDGKPSDKSVNAYLIRRYSKKWKMWQKRLADAEFAYRLMNNAIRAAWVTKGRLLQTLRVIIQGDSSFSIGVESETEGVKVNTGGKKDGRSKKKKQKA